MNILMIILLLVGLMVKLKLSDCLQELRALFVSLIPGSNRSQLFHSLYNYLNIIGDRFRCYIQKNNQITKRFIILVSDRVSFRCRRFNYSQ